MLCAVWLLAPATMMTTYKSRYGLDDTCERLQQEIRSCGWRCSAVRNLNDVTEKDGVVLLRQVRIVELCKPEYAKEVLDSNPEVSTLMPCAFGVYDRGGRVYVTAMNTRVMGILLGGSFARVMGTEAAADERRILESIQ
jgi:uncharacterized protein (DUF302 family)